MVRIIEKDGFRQIHLQVPARIHRSLKVMAAENEQTVTALLTERVIRLVIGKSKPSDEVKTE